MGLCVGFNLFVIDGQFDYDYYILVYVCCYLFVSVVNLDGQLFMICIDVGVEFVVIENVECLFFDENGELIEYMQFVIDFVFVFECDVKVIEVFVECVIVLDLFEKKDICVGNLNDLDNLVKVVDYFGIFQEKFIVFSDDKILEMYKNGDFGVIIVYFIFLQCWECVMCCVVEDVQVLQFVGV